jgi:PAS domain S-box-containing protein
MRWPTRHDRLPLIAMGALVLVVGLASLIIWWRLGDGAALASTTAGVVLLGGAGLLAAREAARQEEARVLVEKTEREARADSDRLLKIIDNTSAVIYMRDVDGHYLLVNHQYEQVFNVKREDLVGMTDHDLFPKAVADAFRANDLRTLARHAPTVVEETAPHPDGPHTYITVKYPITDIDGLPYAVCGISTDITDRKRAEAALRESEQRFRLVAENAPDIIFRFRLRPREEVEYISPAAAAILGRTPAELVGHPRRVLSAVEPADRPRLEESWHSPNPEPLVVRWRRSDGTTILTEQRAAAIHDEDGRLFAVEGILRDITEQVAAQHGRERLEHRLRQVERLDSMGQLAGGVAHDFNNLLAVILGHTELALETQEAGGRVHTDLERIQRAAERGAVLARQLLIFSRLEHSRPEVVNLNAVVEDTGQLLHRTIGEDIELVTSLDPDLSPVRVDRGKLEQILLNVLVNSRAAMPNGGRVTISTKNVDADEWHGGHERFARLSISDTGKGMSPEVAEHAFEPFFTTKERGQGTGLGLSTAYGTVKDAGGDIRIFSEVDKGTTIRIDLPATHEPVLATKDSATAAPGGANATVLVAEDDDDVRDLVERMLSRSDYQVIDATSPLEAIDIAATPGTKIDVLLTDVVMPGMSGVELAEHIRRMRPTLPVLLMSAHTTDSLPGGVVLPPRTTLIRKPFTTATLLGRLSGILGREP